MKMCGNDFQKETHMSFLSQFCRTLWNTERRERTERTFILTQQLQTQYFISIFSTTSTSGCDWDGQMSKIVKSNPSLNTEPTQLQRTNANNHEQNLRHKIIFRRITI